MVVRLISVRLLKSNELKAENAQQPAVEDLFIAWFVVLGAINLFDMLQRDISLPSRVGAFFHVLMCVAMAAMTHPLFMDYWKLHAAVLAVRRCFSCTSFVTYCSIS